MRIAATVRCSEVREELAADLSPLIESDKG